MFQKDLLKGRTILITGGGTGLGRSMALRLAELGANLFLVARRDELERIRAILISSRDAERRHCREIKIRLARHEAHLCTP